MKITFAASEATPFAKTGGLADVVGALPRELAKQLLQTYASALLGDIVPTGDSIRWSRNR